MNPSELPLIYSIPITQERSTQKKSTRSWRNWGKEEEAPSFTGLFKDSKAKINQ
jgi:hypothetical protein